MNDVERCPKYSLLSFSNIVSAFVKLFVSFGRLGST